MSHYIECDADGCSERAALDDGRPEGWLHIDLNIWGKPTAESEVRTVSLGLMQFQVQEQAHGGEQFHGVFHSFACAQRWMQATDAELVAAKAAGKR